MRTRTKRCIGWTAAAVVLLFLLSAATAHAGKVDPFWKVQKEMMQKDVSSGKTAPGALLLDVFIKSSDVEKTKGRVEAAGGNVRTIVGKIMTASVPEKAILDAEGWDEVEYIEAAKPMKQLNDLANSSTGVAAVQAGTGLTQGYDGTGVIVGIIDSGLDLTHPAFLDANGESRVLYVWDQEDATGPAPTEYPTYGTEYKHAQIVSGGLAHKDTDGHGTHVTGIAAGRDSTYPGVAPESSIVMVKYKTAISDVADSIKNTSFTTYVCDAASYVFKKASTLGRPAVINISLGSETGAHDGTSLFDQCLDALLAEASGRAIAVSAGNSGQSQGGGHISYAVSAAKLAGSFLDTASTATIIDVWGPQDCSVSLGISLWDAGANLLDFTPWADAGISGTANLYDGVTPIATVTVDRTETTNTQNGKWHSYFTIATASNVYPNYFFDITLKGTCSSFDAWVSPYSKTRFESYSGEVLGQLYYGGDNDHTVMLPATAGNVLAVGAYATRVSWTDSGGNPQSDPLGLLDDLAYFSSRGPALESAQGYKPNVAAPGMYTISAYSSASSPESKYVIDSQHIAEAGTSMASPHVAGIVALLFQAYPSLTYSQVMSYIQNTASLASAPDSNWGYGKVDALAAINAVLTDYPPGSSSGDFSGISLTGIADGATDVSDTTQSFALTFPRAADTGTCGTSAIFVVPTTASASASKGAWSSTVCNSSSALAGTVSMTDSQNGTLTLDSALGSGTFAFCVSTDVRDSESISFGGKTVTFTTSSGGGGGDGGGGGCAIAPANHGLIAVAIVLLMLGVPLAFRRRLAVERN